MLEFETQSFPDQTVSEIIAYQTYTQNQLVQTFNSTGKRWYVGTNPYVALRYNCDPGGGVRLAFQWYPAETGGTLMGSNTFDTRAGIEGQGSIAALGPYVEIIVTVDAIPRDVSLGLWSARAPHVGNSFNGPRNALISVNGVNVAPGTRTDNAFAVRWGWGHWTSVFDNGVDTRSTLEALDYQNNAHLLDVMGAGISNDSRLVLLPAMPVRLVQLNADAGALNLYASVLMHPGPF